MLSPFGDTFRASHGLWWDFIQDSWPGVAGLVGATVVANVMLVPALSDITPYLTAPRHGNLPVAALLLLLAYALVMVTVVLSVQVGVLRYVRHGERLAPLVNVLGMTGLRFGWRALVLAVIVLAAGLPAIAAAALVASLVDIVGGLAVGALLAVLPIYIGIRLSPWQATFADREKTSLRVGWAASAGAAWGIFWRVFLIPLPVMLLGGLVATLVEQLWGALDWSFVLTAAMLGVSNGLLGILPLALPFAVLAHLWQDLAGEAERPVDDAEFESVAD